MSSKPFSYNSNVNSLQIQRKLTEHSKSLSDAFERLSSGLRINRASDDPAGLAVASDITLDRRVLTQGLRNINDGISLLNVADGAVDQLTDIVIRMKELASQSANGTLSKSQRQALNTEAQALSTEFTRISSSTSFNGRSLFTSTFGDFRVQSGFGSQGGIQAALGGALGTGTFNGVTSTAGTGVQANAVALADLNGDGNLDIVSGTNSTINISLGLGGGAYGAAVSISTAGLSVEALSVGDINNDGFMDILSNQGPGIAVRTGRGDGTFNSFTTYSTYNGANVADVELADMNGDGFLDMVVGMGLATDTTQGHLEIRLNNGSGTFGASATYNTIGTASGLAIGDVNGDGKNDIVAVGYGAAPYTPYSGSWGSFWFGTGTGTLTAGSTFVPEGSFGEMPATRSYDAKLVDLNSDGRLELVTAGITNSGGTTTVRTLTSAGGILTQYSMFNFTTRADSIATADMNGDGYTDLVVGGIGAGGRVSVHLGRNNGTFDTAISYAMNTSATYGLAIGDTNGDGVPDIVTGGVLAGTANVAVRTATTTNGIQPILPFDLSMMANARQAMGIFDNKIQTLGIQRGQIGANMSRMGVASNTLSSAVDEYAQAHSRITDADVAFETAKMVRSQILQEAASAIYAQANQQPQIALQLLNF